MDRTIYVHVNSAGRVSDVETVEGGQEVVVLIYDEDTDETEEYTLTASRNAGAPFFQPEEV